MCPIIAVMWNRLKASRAHLGALVLGGVLTSSVGCVDNTVSVFIRQIQRPVVTGVTCTFNNDPTSTIITEGTLDVALKDSYTLRPLIANQLVTGANMDQRRIETSFLNIEGFVIELREGSPEGPLVGPAFSIYQNVVVPASVAPGTPGYAATSITVIPPQVASALRSAVCQFDTAGVTPECPVVRIAASVNRRILVKMTAFGSSTGQHDVESTPFYFPVTVCCGCLLTFPNGSDTIEVDGDQRPDCNSGMAMPTCADTLGQDDPVDCRSCASTNPSICQPRGFSTNPAGTCPR
ncbi:MAG: hypothetical protein JWM10_392 [Myxococcaceae bacterium]|nr:hypothetical protein [Myxococcaceae bacterium]